jgi:YVTN family beta-propeller protein
VQRIFDWSCSATDCHGGGNVGGGLLLTSWSNLIAGSRYGEVIVPFRPEESHLIDHLTGAAQPRMPLSRDSLPESEIDLIRDWVADGARSDAGAVPYADSRRKVYVCNQGSDQLTVLDADALVARRILDVGLNPGADYPHNVVVDPAGEFFYMTLLGSAHVLKYDAHADTMVAAAPVGQAPANPVASPDGSTLYVTNWRSDNPTLHVLDAATLAERYVLRFPPALGASPHGLCVTRDGTTVYTTHEEAGSVFEIRPGSTAEQSSLTFIPLAGRDTRRLQPLQVVLDAAERFAYVTCLNAGEVQVIDTVLDEVVKVIPIGGNPWLAALTGDGSRIYVANWGKNAVDVIDTAAQELVATLTNQTVGEPVFARPHGVAMSADGTQVYVTNENTNGDFPPHHGGETSGNGNVVVIDVASNEVVKVLEVEVDPTGIAFGSR